MRKCDKCGFDANRDTARFCGRCGESLSSHALLSEGTVLRQRYRIVRVLGRGGMGAVYLVEDRALYGKYWALKELLERFSDAAERADAIAQFQHEARILVTLTHPNLPQMVDAFEEGGRHYLVMEFVEGRTLKAVLDAAPDGRLPEGQVLAWAAQICDVLDYLHGHNPPVVFRDLKPANVMITPEGQIKLLDFGIARLFNPTKGTDTLKMGTVGYAPPEQYAGQGQTTPRSDIYALGATLHESLTGDNPEGHPFVFDPVRRLNPRVSAQTARVIAKAVQLDARDRFPSAPAMKAALMGRKQGWLSVLLIALPLLVLLALGVWLLGQIIPTEPEATPTSQIEVVAHATPWPTATPRSTSTPAPTFTPTPVLSIDTSPSVTTHPPTPTPSLTATPSPSPTPTATPGGSPTPSATPTQEGEATPTSTPGVSSPSPTPSPLPPPPPGELGRIFYTIEAGQTYYLASTDPSWSQGRVMNPAAYEQSTCSGGSTAKTLVGESVNLLYGYRCSISRVTECPSPDGEYKVTIWRHEDGYSMSVHRVSDNVQVHAVYDGQLNDREPILWAPDSSHFYFAIKHTLHRASPYAAGYEPVLPTAYEPYLSPDGSMILYLQPVGTVGAYDVWVANADGSNPRNVTSAPEAYKMCARWGSY
jgi:serine/threonine protein kinase